jgi:hypothetical protein
VSQPLSGQVARLIKSRKHTLSPTQRQMLFTLADRIPRGRLDWETTWKTLADDMVVHPQRLRVAGSDLKRRGLLDVSTTGRGIVIRLEPKFFTAPECSNSLHTDDRQPVAKSYTQSVAKSEVDRPLTIPAEHAPKPLISGSTKGGVCVGIPNQSNGIAAHTPPVAGKTVVEDVLAVPAFDPLDARLVVRLRLKYAETVVPLLESRLRAIKTHLDSHPGDPARGDPAWKAIQKRIKAINAWISGL